MLSDIVAVRIFFILNFKNNEFVLGKPVNLSGFDHWNRKNLVSGPIYVLETLSSALVAFKSNKKEIASLFGQCRFNPTIVQLKLLFVLYFETNTFYILIATTNTS